MINLLRIRPSRGISTVRYRHQKLNFFKGAASDDPHGLFNAGLDAKATRAIHIYPGDELQEETLKELILAAVTYNLSGGKHK